jgi:hypothetical protein
VLELLSTFSYYGTIGYRTTLEDQSTFDARKLDLVPYVQAFLRDLATVDSGPVGTTQIHDGQGAPGTNEFGMKLTHEVVCQLNAVGGITSYCDLSPFDEMLFLPSVG